MRRRDPRYRMIMGGFSVYIQISVEILAPTPHFYILCQSVEDSDTWQLAVQIRGRHLHHSIGE